MKTTSLKPTHKSLGQVLVGALGQPDASTITERALPGLKEKLWLFCKVIWEGGIGFFNFPNEAGNMRRFVRLYNAKDLNPTSPSKPPKYFGFFFVNLDNSQRFSSTSFLSCPRELGNVTRLSQSCSFKLHYQPTPPKIWANLLKCNNLQNSISKVFSIISMNLVMCEAMAIILKR